MKRKEYMERLEQLLLVLPYEEREEALQYYNDYFDDAGVENEDRVIWELGSPEEVAAKIRAGFAGDYGEYSEQGYEDARFQGAQEIMAESGRTADGWEDTVYDAEIKEETGKARREHGKNTNIWKVIAIVLIILIASPLILPLGIAALAVIFGLLVAVFAVILAFGVSGFAILFAGIAVVVAGLAKVLIAPAVGILAAGVGCILLAVGILLSWLIITLVVKVVPGMIRGIVNYLGTPFRKAGAR